MVRTRGGAAKDLEGKEEPPKIPVKRIGKTFERGKLKKFKIGDSSSSIPETAEETAPETTAPEMTEEPTPETATDTNLVIPRVEGENPIEEEVEEENPIEEEVEEENPNEEEGEEENIQAATGSGEQAERQSEEETESDSEDQRLVALRPTSLYLPTSTYRKHVKLGTRCYIKDVFDTFDKLQPPMTTHERAWFETHPQFRHLFHMPRDHNHKVQGMWMLVLRTAEILKTKELWFVVNGVPVRYGLREHCLMSGLNCRNFPIGYKEKGTLEFITRHFGEETVRQEDVKAKLLTMRPGKERLKMAILFFLSSVICVHKKVGDGAPDVLEVFKRVVDDIDYCKTFPWGRLSYNFMLDMVRHTVEHFRSIGEIRDKAQWAIPGFCLPLEILAFEAIPQLGSRFRVSVPGADLACPRMCKSKFKSGDLKGIPIDYINKELGRTTEITSIIPIKDQETKLLRRMFEKDDDRDEDDVVVDGWYTRLEKGLPVFFPDLLEEDASARAIVGNANALELEAPPVQQTTPDLAEILRRLDELEAKVNGNTSRLSSLEDIITSG